MAAAKVRSPHLSLKYSSLEIIGEIMNLMVYFGGIEVEILDSLLD